LDAYKNGMTMMPLSEDFSWILSSGFACVKECLAIFSHDGCTKQAPYGSFYMVI
jgi:hypothetical protein